MEGLYLFARKMVDLKYPEGHKYREMFIVGLYGLLCKYNNYAKLIWILFMQMENYIDDKSVLEIIEDNNLQLEPNNSEDDAISSSIHTFITNQNNDLCHILEKPVVVCSNKENTMLLLNSWCHEMGHLIKSTLNGYKMGITCSYKSEGQLRSGLSTFTYVFNKDMLQLYVSSNNSFLDEAINTIQTTEVIDYIIILYDIVPDCDVKDFLSQTIKYDNNDYGYDLITQEVRKLWEINEFKELVEDNIVEGNIKKIIDDFNETIGDDKAFSKLELLLDHIYNTDNNMDCLMNYSNNVEQFNKLVDKYKSGLNKTKQ